MRYPSLFTPGRLGPLDVRNRFVQTPMQTRGGDADGFVTRELVDYHLARLHPGPGLVVVQQSYAWPAVKVARGLGVWDDAFVPGLAGLAGAIRARGARVFLQLGGMVSRQAAPLAPSPVPCSWSEQTPRALSRAEILHYVDCCARAGRRILAAGFDGFSLHGTAGKFVAQFLSPHSNRRTDEFGGDAARRTRLPLLIVERIREATRDDFPVILRVDFSDFMEGGLSVEEGIEQLALLRAGGVDAFLLSGGGQERQWLNCPPSMQAVPSLLPDMARLKAAVPDAVFIANCGMHDPEVAEAMIRRGEADFIGINRPLLADPEYVDKLYRGRPESIRPCLRCNNCQTWAERPALAGRGACCTINPALMVEESMRPRPATPPRRIVVVGGGLAGMTAAATLAERGHDVELHEKSGELGGQWLAACSGLGAESLRRIVPWTENRLHRSGARLCLKSMPTAESLVALRPDAVVLATGAHPRPLQGVDVVSGESAVSLEFALDLMRDTTRAGRRVVVLGGRYIGLELACRLAAAGREVSVVERGDLGQRMIFRIRGWLFRELSRLKVRLFPHSRLFRVTGGGVEVEHGGSLFFLDADTLALAIGTVPDQSLQRELTEAPFPVYRIGDCGGIGDAREAVSQGAELGLRL